ncbi:hypothetical protein PAMA_000296 [Pampus argenteus]
MEFNKRVHGRLSFILLVLAHIATVVLSGFNNKTGLNLYCTNNMEFMTCYFEGQNCNEYNLTVVSNVPNGGNHHCIPEQCNTEWCCCSSKAIIVIQETHTVTVLKGNQSLESKIIDITSSVKPDRPTIISVNESNGKFEVLWNANVKKGTLINTLKVEVTYHKKGDSNEVSEFLKSTTVAGLNYFEILSRNLEPSTTYVVRVKTYTTLSDLFSDSSEAYEFKTPSRNFLLLAVIVILSAAAVIISGAIYCCFVKIKTKWWDTFDTFQNSKILDMHPSKPQVLKTMPSIISSVTVEPFLPSDSKWVKASLMGSSSESLEQSSGISTGSSLISYAKTEPADIIAGVQDALCKAFANISPISPVVTNPLTELNKGSGLLSTPYNTYEAKADDLSFGSSGFDNKTYSILVPNCSWQTAATDTCENQAQAEMLCDSAYHPIQGETLTCHDKQAPACLGPAQQAISSFMSTDMSYQHNVDSGRYSYTENSSLSSISSGTNTTASCDLASRVENFDEVVSGATKPDGKSEEVTVCDENPCYNCVPANSRSFPPVDDDYQAFQSLVKQPDILFSEQRREEGEERLDRFPEKSSTMILQSFISPAFPDFTNNVQGGRCLSGLQRPFFPLISADQSMPVITDSGYQSV